MRALLTEIRGQKKRGDEVGQREECKQLGPKQTEKQKGAN